MQDFPLQSEGVKRYYLEETLSHPPHLNCACYTIHFLSLLHPAKPILLDSRVHPDLLLPYQPLQNLFLSFYRVWYSFTNREMVPNREGILYSPTPDSPSTLYNLRVFLPRRSKGWRLSDRSKDEIWRGTLSNGVVQLPWSLWELLSKFHSRQEYLLGP